MVRKWKDNYFKYNQVKDQISQKYKTLVDKIHRKEGVTGGKIKMQYFENDENFNSFIHSLNDMIMEEFSKVRKVF